MESKRLKKILAGLCITGLVGGVGLMGCSTKAASACTGTTQKQAQPKAGSSCTGTAKPAPKAGSSCSGTKN